MEEPKEYTWCFACGKANPIGLKLEFERNDEECSATFIPQREHQSYDGRMHGGLISTLLDEVMGNYLYIALPGVQREEIEVDESTFEGVASIKVTVNSGSEFVEVGDEPLILQYPMPSRKIAGAQYRDGVLVIEVASPSETTTKIKID